MANRPAANVSFDDIATEAKSAQAAPAAVARPMGNKQAKKKKKEAAKELQYKNKDDAIASALLAKNETFKEIAAQRALAAQEESDRAFMFMPKGILFFFNQSLGKCMLP